MRQRRYPKLFERDMVQFVEKAKDLHHWLGNTTTYLVLSGDHAYAVEKLRSDIRTAIIALTGDPVVPWAKTPSGDSYPGPKIHLQDKID